MGVQIEERFRVALPLLKATHVALRMKRATLSDGALADT
jgi:hypothetical protein